jgi:hypothetical protein
MTHINQRRDIAANWAIQNPVLQLGEVGWETDTLKAKLGDGSTAWNSLDYAIDFSAYAGFLSGTTVWDSPSVAADGGVQETSFTVTGAAVGDVCAVGLPATFDSGLVAQAWVNAADSVTLRLTNSTASPIDPASATYRVTVFKA